jgi:hypothetical protein
MKYVCWKKTYDGWIIPNDYSENIIIIIIIVTGQKNVQ